MPIIKKTLFPENLERYKVLVEDTDPFSKYFKITELKDTFTGGKNAFLIQGSEDLVSDTLVKIEIKDSQGNVIYHEPGMGIPEYYEGTSKVIAVYVYPDTAYGPCTITILGELSQYDNNGIITPVPPNWEGQYNVRWQKNINVNPSLPNTTKIRFYNRPNISITELIQPLYNRTAITKTATLGTISGTSVMPDVNTNYRTYKGATTYQLDLVGGYFSSSMVGETITVNGLSQSYSTTIANVINQSTAVATTPYYETSSNTPTSSVLDQIIKNFSNKNYSVSYTDSVSYSGSFLSSSYAQITLTGLETFTGDANRIKIYAKSLNQNAGFKLLQDFTLESTELLLTSSFAGDINVSKGTFRAQSIVDQFWTSSLLNSTYPLTASFDNTTLASSVKLIVTSSQNTTNLPLNKFTTKDSLSFLKNTEYTLEYNVLMSASLYTNNKIEIYGSGSAFIDSNSNKLGKLIDTITADGLFQRYDLQQMNFKPDQDGDGKILFVPYQGQWQLADVSLRASQETFFSPNQIIVNVNVPTVIPNETFDFKFEFYDINNNLVYPLSVEKRYSFTGGNDTVVGTITILDGSISSLSASVSGNIAAVSSSISGTMTVYSSSASSSVGTLSGSVSSSLSSLSSSVSASNVYILSSSLSKTQQLADGKFSGSFIGDTVVYSPTIGGQQGYISQKFQVGNTNPIILDARTSTRKIYIGGVNDTGSYNSGSTFVYMDSSGKFSLADKLTFDGAGNLSVNGTINVTGGNAATDAAALLYAARAADSASLSGSAALQFATNQAISASGHTYTLSTALLQTLADGGYSGSFIGSTTIYSPNIGGENGYISKILRVGQNGITLDGGNKAIYVGSGSYNNSNTPFYFASGSTNIFSLGTGLTWNGSSLSIDGAIVARSGYIGNGSSGFTINSSYIGNGKTSLTDSNSGIYVGTDGISLGANSAFKVTSAGALNANSVTITGGTFSIGSNFSLGSDGTLNSTNGNFNGTITAVAGTIGGWNLDTNRIYVPGAISFNSSTKAITIYDTTGTPATIMNQNSSFSPLGGTYANPSSGTPASVSSTTTAASSPTTYTRGGGAIVTNALVTTAGHSYKFTMTEPGAGSGGATAITITTGGTIYYINVSYYYYLRNSTTGQTVGVMSDGASGYGNVRTATWNSSNLTINGQVTIAGDGTSWDLYQTAAWSYSGTSSATGGNIYFPAFTWLATELSSFTEIIAGGIQTGYDTTHYVKLNKLGSGTGGNVMLEVGGEISATGNITAYSASDKKLKENIIPIQNAIDKLNKLNGVEFDWKSGFEKIHSGEGHDVGVIAQEIEEVLPEVVTTRENGYKAVKYEKIVPLLIQAIKELSFEIQELKKNK